MPYIFIYLLICIILGGISCFIGKKMLYWVLGISAFSIGFVICLDQFGSDTTGLVIGLVVGVVCVILLKIFYRVGMFVLGAFAGFALGTLIAGFLSDQILAFQWLVPVLGAIIVGACAVKWFETLVIAITAFLGSFVISTCICFVGVNITSLAEYIYADGSLATIVNLSKYLFMDFALEYAMVILIGTVVLSVVGIIAQMRRR
jgi:hypothetical protein